MKIRHRVTLWVAGAGLLTSFAFSLAVFLEMREQPLRILDSQLGETALLLADHLAKAHWPPKAPEANVLFSLDQPYWFKVYDRDQHLVFQSELSKRVDLPPCREKTDGAFTVRAQFPKQVGPLSGDGEGAGAYRVRVIQAKINDAPCLIQIAKPMGKLEEEFFELLAALGIGLAVSISLLVCMSYASSGRILKPIAEISGLAHEINENRLEQRIPLGRNRDEIHELAACLNRMLDRLQFSFARQKRYLADASHELKSPITMLRLFFEEAVQRRDLPQGMRSQLTNQGDNVLRMERLVKALLDLSVLEIKASLEMEPFSLTDLTRAVLEDFAPLAEQEKIRVDADVPQHLEIFGDRERIRRLLINILDNAFKYNAEGGLIKIHIHSKTDQIRLSVYNTGLGIPGEDLEKVFEPFYRVEKSRSVLWGGAGLGLAIVKEIVRLHQGSLSIDSEPGAWTRVDIVLPRHHRGPYAEGLVKIGS